jgi:lycopene beta-cyclase
MDIFLFYGLSKSLQMNERQKLFVDYLFLGMGAANGLMLLHLFENGLLDGKKIAVLEPHEKNVNDRTFCFWSTPEELEKLKLKDVVSTSWNHIQVNGGSNQSISPLYYYHVKGIDLYKKIKNIIGQLDVLEVKTAFSQKPFIQSDSYEFHLPGKILSAKKVFDSRPPKFNAPKKNQSHLKQSFYGWQITTPEHKFNTSAMVMMDFNVPQYDAVQFMYILPFSEDIALFEVTRFGTEIISQDEAELILQEYIGQKGLSYNIMEKESGVIPMSSAAIEAEDFGINWINTGAKGSMVKPSTGYAFHAMALDACQHAASMKKNETYIRVKKKARFAYYDKLLLKILETTPHHGKRIFNQLFRSVSITTILMFLNEKTSLRQELHIFSKLPIALFVRSAISDARYSMSSIPPAISAFFVTILLLVLKLLHLDYFIWAILGAGFFTIGMAHGAVDHLAKKNIKGSLQFLKYMVDYIAKALLLGLLWIILPDLALLTFIAYSAWHFGQADFKEWQLKQGFPSFLWGLAILFIILLCHFDETAEVLMHIPGLQIAPILKNLKGDFALYAASLVTICGCLMALFNRSKLMALTVCYMLISAWLPLPVSFGIYFVLQHSFHGWAHLKKAYKLNSYQLWKKALPFSIAGGLIIILFLLFNPEAYWGVFFIILSCISIPHVIQMDIFYKNERFTL